MSRIGKSTQTESRWMSCSGLGGWRSVKMTAHGDRLPLGRAMKVIRSTVSMTAVELYHYVLNRRTTRILQEGLPDACDWHTCARSRMASLPARHCRAVPSHSAPPSCTEKGDKVVLSDTWILNYFLWVSALDSLGVLRQQLEGSINNWEQWIMSENFKNKDTKFPCPRFSIHCKNNHIDQAAWIRGFDILSQHLKLKLHLQFALKAWCFIWAKLRQEFSTKKISYKNAYLSSFSPQIWK